MREAALQSILSRLSRVLQPGYEVARGNRGQEITKHRQGSTGREKREGYSFDQVQG
jgi:hypothetical protein